MEKSPAQYNPKLNEYILYFFVYSFLGWIMETVYSYCILGYFDNRGFLIGPICPIYGFGMLILSIWLSKYKNNKFKLFILSSIVLSILEYLTGFLLEAIFKLKWWDYTNDFLNINGRISLFYTLSWGIIAIIVIKLIHPFVSRFISKLINKISNKTINILLKITVVIFIVDIILSSIQYFNLIS